MHCIFSPGVLTATKIINSSYSCKTKNTFNIEKLFALFFKDLLIWTLSPFFIISVPLFFLLHNGELLTQISVINY